MYMYSQMIESTHQWPTSERSEQSAHPGHRAARADRHVANGRRKQLDGVQINEVERDGDEKLSEHGQ